MHPRDKDAFTLLATRYLSGEASSEERERLANQLKDPACNEWFTALQRAWDATQPATPGIFDAHATSQRVAREIARERIDAVKAPLPSASPVRFRLRAWFAIAALFIVAITGTWFFSRAHKSSTTPESAWLQRTTALGERTTLTLQDGTKVTLNAGSTLAYPADFDRYARVVRLTGEAFFDVTRDEARPFVVETATLRTTVLGTHFNVAAFAGETQSSVSLVEGRVQVLPLSGPPDRQSLILVPGQQYTFSRTTAEGAVQTFDPGAVTGWMHGVLIFDREPLASAAQKLCRHFGVPVKLDRNLSPAETITGRFEKESLPEICEILRLTGAVDFRLEQSQGHITSVRFIPAHP